MHLLSGEYGYLSIKWQRKHQTQKVLVLLFKTIQVLHLLPSVSHSCSSSNNEKIVTATKYHSNLI